MKFEEMDWNGETKQPLCTVKEEEENFSAVERKQAGKEKRWFQFFLGKYKLHHDFEEWASSNNIKVTRTVGVGSE